MEFLNIIAALAGTQHGDNDAANNDSADAEQDLLDLRVAELSGSGLLGVIDHVFGAAAVCEFVEGARQLATGALDVALNIIDLSCHGFNSHFHSSLGFCCFRLFHTFSRRWDIGGEADPSPVTNTGISGRSNAQPAGLGESKRILWGAKVVAMSDENRLKVGDVAPDFALVDDRGERVSLYELTAQGQRVLVYFYPRANTPGCTKEACDFRDNLEVLNDLGVEVVGISPDKPEKLAKFREDHGLTFRLLSDPEKEVMTAWGAFGEKKNYGKVVQGVIRSTLMVEADNKVSLAKYNVRATGHVARIVKELNG